MSGEAPKPPTTSDLLVTLIEEIRGLRSDMRQRGGLPDVRIGKGAPKDWRGPSYEGKQASECPGEFLLGYAALLEWKAGKNREDGKDGYAAGNEREALMCRRWAAVNRAIAVPAPEKTSFRKPDAAPPADTPAQQGAASAEAPKAKWSGGGGWQKKQGVQS